jgi:inosine-uridine nucleoside N-ribohydrolase
MAGMDAAVQVVQAPDYMRARRRAVISTDAKNQADDQYAIVHALLSPIVDVRGIVPAHFGTDRGPHSLQESRAEVDLLLDLLGLTGSVHVANGAERALVDERTPQDSEGARLMVEEARQDASTLFLVAIGPLTDVASAILLDREVIEQRAIVVWVGGPPYGDRLAARWPETNLARDVHAARVVFGSAVELWQVPMSTYTQLSVSHEELRLRVRPHGSIGRYLVDQLLEVAEAAPVRLESHALCDTAAIGLVINPGAAVWRAQPPVQIAADLGYEPTATGAHLRVAEHVDSRFMLNDLFAKLEAFDLG